MPNNPQHRSLWEKCLGIIKDNISDELFEIWFSQTKSIGFADNVLTIEIPNEFHKRQYEGRFAKVLSRAIHEVYGPSVEWYYSYYIIEKDPETLIKLPSADSGRSIADSPSVVTDFDYSDNGPVYEDIDSELDLRCNFENYCVGESNRLAYTIAESIGNNPKQTTFNPFFLYGSTGVGKTHLIQAIGVRIKEHCPALKVFYTTTRAFVNEYRDVVRKKKVNDFINFYQSIDVLLIDDVQELSGNPGTQKAFFPIFSYLHQKGKLLILTSDRTPAQIEGVMDRLLSRFNWGIMEQLPGPDIELRKDILRMKAARNGLQLPEDVIDLIANHVANSVRDLEGIVLSLITRATILNQAITTDLANLVVQSFVKTIKKRINFDMIVESTASYYGIDADVIFSKNKVREIADARQLIMYLANKHTDLSSTAIGNRLARSHATVLHGINVVKSRIEMEPQFADSIQCIEKMFV